MGDAPARIFARRPHQRRARRTLSRSKRDWTHRLKRTMPRSKVNSSASAPLIEAMKGRSRRSRSMRPVEADDAVDFGRARPAAARGAEVKGDALRGVAEPGRSRRWGDDGDLVAARRQRRLEDGDADVRCRCRPGRTAWRSGTQSLRRYSRSGRRAAILVGGAALVVRRQADALSDVDIRVMAGGLGEIRQHG